MLRNLTDIVNFLGLALAVWLGIYLVTRSPRSLIAWLTGFTLWSLAGLFLNILLALNPPPNPTGLPSWFYLFIPWRPDVFEMGGAEWLQGWLVIPAVAFWHHVTVLMRPGRMNRWRWTRVLVGYALSIIAVNVLNHTSLMFTSAAGDPLYLTTLKPGPLYALFMVFLLCYASMSLYNLIRSARATPGTMLRKQLNILVLATLIAGITVPVAFISYFLQAPFPRVIQSFLLACAIVLIGYGVARYSALVEGRTIRRDFFYNALSMGLVIFLYLIVTWFSVRFFGLATTFYIFVLILVIVTHSLIDVTRHSLDFLFFRRDVRRLRSDLRKLAKEAGEHVELNEALSLILNSLCVGVKATYGLVIICENGELRQAATYQWPHAQLPVTWKDVTSDDILLLKQGDFPPPLAEAALLVPLYADSDQVGALLLGRPVNGISYSKSDLDLILYPSDQLAEAFRYSRREREFLSQVTHLAQSPLSSLESPSEAIPVEVLENALRNLHDYAYLGDCPLSDLKLIDTHLPEGPVTHLDQGKAVHEVMLQGLNQLRPGASEPNKPPPREWYSYLILRDAYLDGVPNNEIMARLYVSEGTFHRTRRAAIRSMARALSEMEAAIH